MSYAQVWLLILDTYVFHVSEILSYSFGFSPLLCGLPVIQEVELPQLDSLTFLPFAILIFCLFGFPTCYSRVLKDLDFEVRLSKLQSQILPLNNCVTVGRLNCVPKFSHVWNTEKILLKVLKIIWKLLELSR